MIWPIVRLGALIAETRNGLYKHADFYGRGTPILKMFNLLGGRLNLSRIDRVELDTDEFAAYRLQGGDILMNRVNTPELVGKCAVIPHDLGDAVFESKNIRIRLRSEVADSRFFAAYLNSSFGRPSLCQGIKHAIGMATINNGDVRDCSVALPPLKEQRRIVEILEQADALRQKRTEADAFADCIPPALFNKLFGDPSKNPKGWPYGTLEHAGATVRYGLGQPPKSSDEGLPLLRATNLHRGQIFTDNLIRVRRQDIPPGRNAILKAEEVIVVRSGAYTGDAAQVTEEWEGSVAGYDLVINPGEKLVGEFLESFLLTSFIQKNYFASIKARAGQPHLNADQVGNTPLILPPKQLQERFATHVKALRKDRVKRLDAAAKLNTLFAAILHRAFTGELTAKWREAHMKELLAEMEQQARLLRSSPNGRN